MPFLKWKIWSLKFKIIPNTYSTTSHFMKDVLLVNNIKSHFFQNSNSRTKATLEFIHTNICRPMQTKSLNESIYFPTFIDDYFWFIIIYFFKSKYNVFSMFLSYKALVEIQMGNKIKCLKFDNEGEYTSSHFIKFCEGHDIVQQYIMSYTFKQNKMLEWSTCILVEVVCMLTTTKCHIHFGLKLLLQLTTFKIIATPLWLLTKNHLNYGHACNFFYIIFMFPPYIWTCVKWKITKLWLAMGSNMVLKVIICMIKLHVDSLWVGMLCLMNFFSY